LILARAARLSLIGAGAGMLAASASERFLAGLIPGAQFSNTLVSASALVFACALFAALIPALRAARIDPARCLRQ
jgi:ABC-type lipoprotein release transport system permease subunit